MGCSLIAHAASGGSSSRQLQRRLWKGQEGPQRRRRGLLGSRRSSRHSSQHSRHSSREQREVPPLAPLLLRRRLPPPSQQAPAAAAITERQGRPAALLRLLGRPQQQTLVGMICTHQPAAMRTRMKRTRPLPPQEQPAAAA